MRQWIGLIVVGIAGYFLWTQYGDRLRSQSVEPATPEVAWYIEEVRHHFSIVEERGKSYALRGFQENTTTKMLLNVRIKVFLREGEDWKVLDTYNLENLEPQQRKVIDYPIHVPKDLDKPKLRWEITQVTYR